MLRYAINKITYDYFEITIIYSSEEFLDMVEKATGESALNLDEDDFQNLVDNQYLKMFIQIDAEGIVETTYKNKYKILLNFEPLLKFGDLSVNEDEVQCILSIPYIDATRKIKIPSPNDIKYDKVKLKEEDYKKLLNYLLIIKGLYTTSNVDQVSEYCDVYIKMLGDDVKILSYKPSTEYLNFEQMTELFGRKIGDTIKLENTETKLLNGDYPISKIVKYEPLELNDDNVKIINYKNIKDSNTFIDSIKKDYAKILDFSNYINKAFDVVTHINVLNISKFTYKHLCTVNNKVSNLSKERKYGIIEMRIIYNYLYLIYQERNVDISGLEKHFKTEYEFLTMLEAIHDIDFDEYLNNRGDEAILYQLIREKR